MTEPVILAPNLQINQNLIPYDDLDIQGDFGRKQRYPHDVLPTITALEAIDTNKQPRMLRSTPDGHLIVHPDVSGGGGGGTIINRFQTITAQTVRFDEPFLSGEIFDFTDLATFPYFLGITAAVAINTRFDIPVQGFLHIAFEIYDDVSHLNLWMLNGELLYGYVPAGLGTVSWDGSYTPPVPIDMRKIIGTDASRLGVAFVGDGDVNVLVTCSMFMGGIA